MFGPCRIPYIDSLYFWDSNVDHKVGRAMMARNFSNISVGVLKQVRIAQHGRGRVPEAAHSAGQGAQ
jgi:hypothetical protein